MIHSHGVLHNIVQAQNLPDIGPAGQRKPGPEPVRRTAAAKCPEKMSGRGIAHAAPMQYIAEMPEASNDQRILRTRAAILGAFVRLAFERRYDAIRIADLVAAAGIGRSTFYEHFRSKNDVLLTAMEPVLLALSIAASGRAARPYVKSMVTHLWERRSTGRMILGPATAPALQRRLAEMIRLHVDRAETAAAAPSIKATGVAAAQIAMLRAWLAGEASCSTDEITDQVIACSKLIA